MRVVTGLFLACVAGIAISAQTLKYDVTNPPRFPGFLRHRDMEATISSAETDEQVGANVSNSTDERG